MTIAWRLHLTNQAIQRVDILPGKPPLLGVWLARDRAAFFDLESGAQVGETPYKAPAVESRQSARWQEFVAGLTAPNGAALPVVRAGSTTIYTTEDGRMRLYVVGDELYLETDGKEVKLDTSEATFTTIGIDRFLGLIAALDEQFRLAIYQQHIRVGLFDTGLKAEDDAQPGVAVSNGGSAIFVTNSHEVVPMDSGGRVRKRLPVHYPVGRMACAPNGKLLLLSDAETGVIRAYSSDLTPTHQRHAIDLLQDAPQLQLIADLPPASAGVGALAVDNQGTVAFALSGVVCVTSLERMTPLPRPQPLL
ncbi:MAG: hypothetical protein HZC41_03070 [Chloroflexi bacterium]|nr:hypothetical protein [Chloroflexota bacterium]